MKDLLNLEWHTEQRKVSDLIPFDKNPRKISNDKLELLKKSIEKYGFVEIPVIDMDNILIAGHQRLKAMLLLDRGDEMIDVRVPNRKLSEKELKEYNIQSNVSIGEWDIDVLIADFNDIDLPDLGIDLDLLEFQESDVFEKGKEKFVKIKSESNVEAQEDDFEIPEKIETNIVRGDLIEIGKHRLMCGDSTSIDDVEKLMNGEKADLIFTDPPYGVSIGKKNVMLNSFQKAKRNLTDIEDDDLNEKELDGKLSGAFSNLFVVSHDHCAYYVCAPQNGNLGLMMMMMMNKSYTPVRHVLNWIKNSPTFSLGRLDYDYQHEPILFGWKKTHKRIRLGKFQTTVWYIDKPRANKEHPTMKPVALPENAILNSSEENDIVVDIYLGSGTTMVASHQLNRKCFGMEISPEYCQVIINRMQKLDPNIEIKINGKAYKI